MLAPVRVGRNCAGISNPCLGITVHQTANTSRGANAKKHGELQARIYKASWHYTVDDHEIVQSFQDNVQCWHAGDGVGYGNLNTIAVETCVNVDSNYNRTIENLCEFLAFLCKKHNLNPNKDIYQHNHFSGKDCPQQIRAGKNGITWKTIIEKTNYYFKQDSHIDKKTLNQLIRETLAGKYGNGEARKQALGSRYKEVQEAINEGKTGNEEATGDEKTMAKINDLVRLRGKEATQWWGTDKSEAYEIDSGLYGRCFKVVKVDEDRLWIKLIGLNGDLGNVSYQVAPWDVVPFE